MMHHHADASSCWCIIMMMHHYDDASSSWCHNVFIQRHVLWWQTCVGKYWNITAFDSINLCNCPILFYYTSDLRVKVYATSDCIIPAVASRACHKLAEKYIQRNYTRVTSLVLYINRISMSFCLFICLFVCLFVLKLLLEKSICIRES